MTIKDFMKLNGGNVCSDNEKICIVTGDWNDAILFQGIVNKYGKKDIIPQEIENMELRSWFTQFETLYLVVWED